VQRLSISVDGRLAGTVDDALDSARFVGLNETELLLPAPWIDDPAFHHYLRPQGKGA
jgi:hypothetical protein